MANISSLWDLIVGVLVKIVWAVLWISTKISDFITSSDLGKQLGLGFLTPGVIMYAIIGLTVFHFVSKRYMGYRIALSRPDGRKWVIGSLIITFGIVYWLSTMIPA